MEESTLHTALTDRHFTKLASHWEFRRDTTTLTVHMAQPGFICVRVYAGSSVVSRADFCHPPLRALTAYIAALLSHA